MEAWITATYISDDETDINLSYIPTNTCPLCHTSFNGTVLSAYLLPKDKINGKPILSVLHFCHCCEQCFLSTYTNWSNNLDDVFKLMQSAPFTYLHERFDNHIHDLSPRFVEIFNQASDAEKYGLYEICGTGYRKALEFLVKDYCIHINPGEKENIKTASLSECIDKCIKDKNLKIKTLAQKSAWLGNDQTHYVNKHIDRDIEDLKKFIKAMSLYISMELVTEDASSIEKS